MITLAMNIKKDAAEVGQCCLACAGPLMEREFSVTYNGQNGCRIVGNGETYFIAPEFRLMNPGGGRGTTTEDFILLIKRRK